MRNGFGTLAVALLAAACVVGPATDAAAQDKPAVVHPDPLDPLRDAMKEQDDLLDNGKADKAIADAEKRAEDGTPENLYLLGRALGNKAFHRATQQRMERMRARKAGSDEPPPEFVLDAESKDLVEKARDAFERASEAGKLVYAPAYLGIGRIALLKGDLDPAIEALKQAVRIAPNFREAALELAGAYGAKRLDSEAEFTLQSFLKERPTDTDARVLLGLMFRDRKRFGEAEQEFRAVLAADPKSVEARRHLAAVMMYQEHFEDAAAQWELVRAADPKDEQAYICLFQIYLKLKRKDAAAAMLKDLAAAVPGTEAARRANAELQRVKDDPSAWDESEQSPQETLVRRLESKDSAARQKALEDMRAYRWPALPAAVYQTLLKDRGTRGERLAAVRLISDLADPHTLTILEILLLHPDERETEKDVRDEVAHAVSLLPSDAIVPILFVALSDADADVREFAVQGFAARTGKWFRSDLKTRTADAAWPAEYERYQKWWNSSSASSVKRGAMTALASIYEPVAHDSKMRIAQYALPAMDDPVEATWRAGYDLFRALTFHSFGSDEGDVAPEERKRIAAEANRWLEEQLGGKKTDDKKPVPQGDGK